MNFDPDAAKPIYQDIVSDHGDGTLAIGETYYAHTRIDHVFHYPKDLPILQAESGLVDLETHLASVPGFRDHRPIVVSYDLTLQADGARK